MTVTDGLLPAGLTLSPTGVLYGTPVQVGAYSFTVTATHSAGSSSRTFTVQVGDEPNTPGPGGQTPGPNGPVTTPPTKTAKANSSIKVRLAKKKIRATKRVKATVTVKAKGVARPTGKIVVTVGKKKVAKKLKARHKGKITVKLPKVKRGKHKVRANYKGSKTVKKSKTKKAVTLRVLRAK